MALQKQAINLNFAQGLDLKTDPNQVQANKFLAMNNAVFQNGGGLQKRNGFGSLTKLPNENQTSLLTYNGELIAAGTQLYSYSADVNAWYNQGKLQPVDLEVKSLIRNSTSQSRQDCAIAPNGLACVVYVDNSVAYYHIVHSDGTTSVVGRTALPSTASNPRVVLLGNYFVITYGVTVSGSPNLAYIAIPVNTPNNPSASTTLATTIFSISAAYDAVVSNNKLYVAFKGNDGGGAIRLLYMSSTLVISSQTVISSYVADYISITADTSLSTPTIWVSFWDSVSTNITALARDANLTAILAPTSVSTAVTINAITSLASGNICTVIYENVNNYSYAATRSDYVTYKTVTSAGVVSAVSTVARSVGIASKAFYANNGTAYLMTVYGGAYQPTYFMMDLSGNIYSKLAYSNAYGYVSSFVLPNITVNNNTVQFCYLVKTLLTSVNKSQGATAVAGIYSQIGINLANLTFNNTISSSSEIASALNITSGLTWMYTGLSPVELGFNVWPEDLLTTVSGAGGTMTAQQYYYVATYEWNDDQGNLHRSAPSVPIGALTTTGTSSVVINIPYLRLTYKTGANPVRLVLYRWSTAQQIYYQITSISNPITNVTTSDSYAYTDTVPDSSILGNPILYTTGGVIENIAPPASFCSALFRNRLCLVDSENRNTIWYSKQVIQGTAVEMSDLLTIYVAPSTGAQGSTGPITALSAMDDKLIIFKEDAIYYVTGNGPDNTGANNDFSEPTFITGAVGCTNQKSIVMMPNGIMFQSDKGIWLLGRDLSTKYIGAAVESYNPRSVVSALCIPGTNQVRFVLDNGSMLMYDYYYDQWGTFSGISPISATLYNGFMTCLDAYGKIYKETPNHYLDGSRPVLLSFTTAWIKLTNLQGYQRAYFIFLLSNYLTPHKLNVNISYDYSDAIIQTSTISPDNYSPAYGGDSIYGGSEVYGGQASLEQWRIFLSNQRCQSIKLNVNEVYDASKGVIAGAGLTMSGINMVIGAKGGYPKISAKNSVG